MGKTSSQSHVNAESRYFGYRRVDAAQKKKLVGEVFASVASRYDVMNDLMSGGLHRLWKDEFVALVDPQPGQAILDLASGTGDIALRLLQRTQGQAKVTLCDNSPDMLTEGRAKLTNHGFWRNPLYQVADAADLPFANHSFDRITIAFGLRNVTLIDDALHEAWRVLKIGGKFFCLEFTPAVHPALKKLYDAYSFTVLPVLGKLVANDSASYRYLAESIRQFPAPEALAKRMRTAGFKAVRYYSIMGGIAAIHEALKV